MWQALFKFFVGLGLAAAVATTLANYTFNYYQNHGTFDGSGLSIPVSVHGSVPEIDPARVAPLTAVLLGGLALVTSRRRTSTPN